MSDSSQWVKAAFFKLARLGAIVFLPTTDGKYLMQVADADDESAEGKLRPPGGGQDTKDKNLTQTIIRELGEEFGLERKTIKKNLRFLGYEYRDKFWGNAVFELRGHGLHPGVYQASNDPDEKVKLVESTLDSKRYVGPDPEKLLNEKERGPAAAVKSARFITYKELEEYGKQAKGKMLRVYMHNPTNDSTRTLNTMLRDGETPEQGAIRTVKDTQEIDVDETAIERMPNDEDGDKRVRVLLPGKAKEASAESLAGRFNPDYTPEQMEEMGDVQARLYHRTKPHLASMESWPSHWTTSDDTKGWVEWYQQYHEGRRSAGDAKQIQRWLSFKARCGSTFTKNPTPRRAWALVNWGIDPIQMLPEAARAEFKQKMDDYKSGVDKGGTKSARTDGGRFHKPENFEKIKELSTKDFTVEAGGNDWEETWSGVTITFANGKRVWAHFDIPDSLSSEGGVKKPGEDKDWGKRIVEKWLAAARKDKEQSDYLSWQPECFTETADDIPGIKEHGMERMVWQSIKESAVIDLDANEALLEDMARLFPLGNSGTFSIIKIAEKATGEKLTTPEAEEDPFYNVDPDDLKAKIASAQELDAKVKGHGIRKWTCGCTSKCRCPDYKPDTHPTIEMGEDCYACKAGIKKKAATDLLPNPTESVDDGLRRPMSQLRKLVSGPQPIFKPTDIDAAFAVGGDQEAKTGPEAIMRALHNIDLDAKHIEAMDVVKRKLKSKRPDAVKVLGYIDGLKKMGYQPHELMITKVPVIPPQFRPYSVAGETFVPGDSNELYRDLINLVSVHKDLETKLGAGSGFNKLNIYDAVSALYGYGEPTSPKTRERGVSGFLKKVTGTNPKFSFIQRKMLSKDQDYVARGVIGVDPELGLDEIGVPDDVMWTLYAPYVQRALVRSGMSPEEALRAVRDRTGPAEKMLDQHAKERPVIYSRAPSWHKFNVIAGYPKRSKGDMIRINPLVTTGLNADFDGDTLNVHLPSMPEAVADAKDKLMPSKMLFSIKDPTKVVPTPKQEFIMGLFNAQRRVAKNIHNFPDEASALAAIKNGQVNLSDEVKINGV